MTNPTTNPKVLIEVDVPLDSADFNNKITQLINVWKRNPQLVQEWTSYKRDFKRKNEEVIKLQLQVKDLQADKTKLANEIRQRDIRIKNLTTDKSLFEKEIEKNLYESILPVDYRVQFLISVFQGFIILGLKPEYKDSIDKYMPHIERALKALRIRQQDIYPKN